MESQSRVRQQSQLFTIEITDFCKDGCKSTLEDAWANEGLWGLSSITYMVRGPWPTGSITHPWFRRWKRGRGPSSFASGSCWSTIFSDRNFCDGRSALYSMIYHCVVQSVQGSYVDPAAAFSCLFLAYFNVISIFISNMQKGKEYNKHPCTIHLVSIIILILPFFLPVSFVSKLKTSWYLTSKYFNMYLQRAGLILQLTMLLLHVIKTAVIPNIT